MYLRWNKFTTFPDSILEAKFLQILELDYNPLNFPGLIKKCRAKVVKSRGLDKKALLKFIERCEKKIGKEEEEKPEVIKAKEKKKVYLQ